MPACSTGRRASGHTAESRRPSRHWPALRARSQAVGKAEHWELSRDRPVLPGMRGSTPSPDQVSTFRLDHSLSHPCMKHSSNKPFFCLSSELLCKFLESRVPEIRPCSLSWCPRFQSSPLGQGWEGAASSSLHRSDWSVPVGAPTPSHPP